MRKVINCAITLALLVISAAAQQGAIATVKVADKDVEVPAKGVIRALVADLSIDTPVKAQWESGNGMYTYAFDFIANSFSEEWRTSRSLIFARTVVGGSSTTFSRGRCAKTQDATVWVSAVKRLFDSVTVSEGLVYDAFDFSNPN